MKRHLVCAAIAAGIFLSGCGGGNGSSAETAPDPISRSMDAPLVEVSDNLNTAGTSGTPAADAVGEVAAANQLMANLSLFSTRSQATTRAVYTKQIGGMTITLTTSVVNLIQTNYTIVLNGAVTTAGPTYNNFTFATGTVKRSNLNGKRGTVQTVTYNELKNGGSAALLATAENWFFDDGSGQGFHNFPEKVFLTYTYDTTKNWNWSAFTGGDSIMGTLRAQVTVKSDKSGTAKVFCVTDHNLRAQATWTAVKTGEVCAFPTACGSQDGCSAFPK